MKTILFVCTGNTCRSTMAEGLFKHILTTEKHTLGDVKVISAGTCANQGERASLQAIEVFKEKGISLENHRATPLTKELVMGANLVLTMTLNHKKAVLDLCPEARNKVFTLKEYVGNGKKIDKALDEMNEIYKELNRRKEQFIVNNEKRLKQLKEKRQAVLKQLKEIDREVEAMEGEFRDEIQELEDQLMKLEKKMPGYDIVDPFGQPVEVYRKSALEIEENLKKLLEKLQKGKL